mmetsp:Transcript_4704/g.7541  ORF Transcript_4704/g.7541 Transcript_4704/m.7541 type:complete len:253 (-) Transcript_4704:251-1009(-)
MSPAFADRANDIGAVLLQVTYFSALLAFLVGALLRQVASFPAILALDVSAIFLFVSHLLALGTLLVPAILCKVTWFPTLLALDVSAVFFFVSHLLALGTEQSSLSKCAANGGVCAAKRAREVALHHTKPRRQNTVPLVPLVKFGAEETALRTAVARTLCGQVRACKVFDGSVRTLRALMGDSQPFAGEFLDQTVFGYQNRFHTAVTNLFVATAGCSNALLMFATDWAFSFRCRWVLLIFALGARRRRDLRWH